MKAFLDTHAAVALDDGTRSAFGAASLDLIDRAALFFSPAVRLELRFLERIGRLRYPASEILLHLHRELGVTESNGAGNLVPGVRDGHGSRRRLAT